MKLGMKPYLFFVELPLLEKSFYFSAEETVMKKPLIAKEHLGEDDILEARYNQAGEVEFKKSCKTSAQLILNEIRKQPVVQQENEKVEKLFYHYHNLFEISMVTSGKGYYFAEGRCIEVKAGSIIIFNRLIPHAWQADTQDPPHLKTFKFYQNLFLGEALQEEKWQFLKNYLNQLTVLALHEAQAEQSCTLLQLIYEEYQNKQKGYKEGIKNLLLVFLMYMMRGDHPIKEGVKPIKSNVQIENAVQYMKNNFHLNVTLEDVAKVVYMHPNYFSAVFKKNYGISFSDYMNYLKVSMATELMESTPLTVSEIAMQCGFNSVSNFYRVFKALQGVSPVKYVKQIKFQ